MLRTKSDAAAAANTNCQWALIGDDEVRHDTPVVSRMKRVRTEITLLFLF